MKLNALVLPSSQPETAYLKELEKAVDEFSLKLEEIFNNNITFADNFKSETKSLTTNATPDTEDAVSHTLGEIPTGYIVVSKDKAAHIYDGTTSWTRGS